MMLVNGEQPLYVYVDVDDTFVRSIGSKRIPIPSVIQHVQDLKKAGAVLYCWSSGGAAYAKESAEEFGIAHCFEAFLPKPQIILDDQGIEHWRYCLNIHPSNCGGKTVQEYRTSISNRPKADN